MQGSDERIMTNVSKPPLQHSNLSMPRPILITLVCFFEAFAAVGMFASLSPWLEINVKNAGPTLHSICFSLSGTLKVFGVIGLWNMKKWSVVLVVVSAIIYFVPFVVNNNWPVVGILISVVIVAIMVYYFPKMR